MSRKLLSLSLTAALMGGTAMADVPNVAVDIAPVHSLVARVMQGVGTPDLVIPAGASPHHYSLRPSEAAALQNADLVFWMGEDLTPWLEGAIETLAEDATVTEMLQLEETELLDFRESALFEAHAHGDEHHDDHDDHDHDEHAEGEHDDHDHGEHDDHDHGDHAEGEHDDHDHGDHAEDEHDDHDHGEHAEGEHDHDDHHDHGHDEHAHGEHDPHAWLSPHNASVWLNVIAAKLSAADPENAGAYFGNAATAVAEIEALETEINGVLDPYRGHSFIVFHDAYQYFEAAFNFPASGAISLGDAADPGPARIAEIQARIQNEGVDCVLSEPQYDPNLVETVLGGTEAKTSVIDPLGSNLTVGPELYPNLIRNMAKSLADCL